MITLDQSFILSDGAWTIPPMHHPWRRLREVLPDWQVILRPLPAGFVGGTDTEHRTITIDSRTLQAQRRSTLDHELVHAEAGDVGCQHRARESAVNQESARRLLPVDELLRVLPWATTLGEAAEECWVDSATMAWRLDHLHPSERAAIKRAIAARDNEESQ